MKVSIFLLFLVFLSLTSISCGSNQIEQAPETLHSPNKEITRPPTVELISQIYTIDPHGKGYVIFIPTDEAFGKDKSSLTPASKKKLQKLATYLTKITDLQVYGLTDNSGDSARNKTLSQIQAEAVARELQKSGVPEKNIVRVEGLGGTVPMADNSTPSGRKKNRRIEIIFVNVIW